MNEEKKFDILFVYHNEYLDEYYIEVKRLDLPSSVDKSKRCFWFKAHYYKHEVCLTQLEFKDSGLLNSGKNLRILKDKFYEYPTIIVFDDKKLEIHQNDWDLDSGTYLKMLPGDVPPDLISSISDYVFKKQ